MDNFLESWFSDPTVICNARGSRASLVTRPSRASAVGAGARKAEVSTEGETGGLETGPGARFWACLVCYLQGGPDVP